MLPTQRRKPEPGNENNRRRLLRSRCHHSPFLSPRGTPTVRPPKNRPPLPGTLTHTTRVRGQRRGPHQRRGPDAFGSRNPIQAHRSGQRGGSVLHHPQLGHHHHGLGVHRSRTLGLPQRGQTRRGIIRLGVRECGRGTRRTRPPPRRTEIQSAARSTGRARRGHLSGVATYSRPGEHGSPRRT